MTDVSAVLPKEEHEQPNKAPTDVLGRQEFVNQLISVAETLAANKKNACYSLNGEWGVGKTFVLKAFEEQLRQYGQPDTTLSKYLAFHYNCWQYDYYDEPLIAIVASLLDQIDEQVNLLSETQREPMKVALKRIGAGALKAAGVIIEKKFGVDPNAFINEAVGISKEANDNLNAVHEYDSYFDFKKTLSDLSGTIKKLASEQTVIFVVDELDRCLPEYTIKILERLHHIFADVPNVQVILSVDRAQLENTIINIYGEATSVRKYLEKFIQFEIKLTAGEVTDIIEELYPQYHDYFKVNITPRQDVNEVCRVILNGVDIRTSKAIVEKSMLCHRLLNSDDEYQDSCILFLEVFLTLLKQYGLNKNSAKLRFRIDNIFIPEIFDNKASIICNGNANPLRGLIQLGNIYSNHNNYKNYFTNDQYRQDYVRVIDIWGLILASYRSFIGFEDQWIDDLPYRALSHVKYPKEYIMEYINKYWNFLQIIS